MSYYGFYNGYLLKSSYEYAYALYLDSLDIIWKYEELNYQLNNDVRYTPDFFLYDDKNNLQLIVEIRGDRRRYEEGKTVVKELREKGLNAILITDKDLRKILKEENMSLDKVVYEWISSNETKYNMGMPGENNPNYGNRHSDKTKYLIGKKAKERWENEIYRTTMMKIMKENGIKISMALKGKLKAKRVTRNCKLCNEEYIVTEGSKKIYCSQLCAANDNFRKATEVYTEKMNNIHREIKEYAIKWTKINKEKVIATPFNRITNLQMLFDKIEINFGIKDMRIISKSISSIESRKEMLKFLKNVATN